jgi:hypothetical protein
MSFLGMMAMMTEVTGNNFLEVKYSGIKYVASSHVYPYFQPSFSIIL